MSKRPGFIYDGSKIVIVPTESFCGPPAKIPKLNPKTLSEAEPILVSNVQTAKNNTQINQSQNNSVNIEKPRKVCVGISAAIQKNNIGCHVTSKMPVKVPQAVNKSDNSQKDIKKVNKKEAASSAVWTSPSIAQTHKKPINVSF